MTERARRTLTVAERIHDRLLRRTPTWVLLIAAGGIAVGRGLRWLAVHTIVVCTVALAGLTWWAIDRGWWPWLLGATGILCLGLGAVMELQPRWWQKLTRAAASRRRLAWYRKRWEPAMVGAGLTIADDLPTLTGHRFGGQPWERDLDILTVRTLPGQTVVDWRHVSDRLAAAWGRTRVRAHVQRGHAPAVLELFCSSRPLPEATIRRAAVAGGQLPPLLRGNVQPASTDVDEPVDGPDQPSGASSAFPRTPRAEDR